MRQHFAYAFGHIVTANADGSVPLNSKVVAEVQDVNATFLEGLLEQANAAPIDELQRRLNDILDLIDGREDVEDGDEGRQRPNIFMQIAQIANGEDRP